MATNHQIHSTSKLESEKNVFHTQRKSKLKKILREIRNAR